MPKNAQKCPKMHKNAPKMHKNAQHIIKEHFRKNRCFRSFRSFLVIFESKSGFDERVRGQKNAKKAQQHSKVPKKLLKMGKKVITMPTKPHK